MSSSTLFRRVGLCGLALLFLAATAWGQATPGPEAKPKAKAKARPGRSTRAGTAQAKEKPETAEGDETKSSDKEKADPAAQDKKAEEPPTSQICGDTKRFTR